MKRVFNQIEKRLVFELWKSGKGFSAIGKVIGAKPGSVFTILREHGGIQPKPKTRSKKQLSLEEREDIRAYLSANKSYREIASLLKRAPSTISREVNKNGGRLCYRAITADNRAWISSRRPQLCLLQKNKDLCMFVREKMNEKWSPEQISVYLPIYFKHNKDMRISYETIYKTLYIRSRKTLKSSLMVHLRRSHRMRQGKKHSRRGNRGTINIANGNSIHQRPKNADTRKEIGHWEGDLVSGSNNTHIATLVDRKTRFTIILKIKGKDAASVNEALIRKFSLLDKSLKKSLTWDRGMELAKHSELTKATGVKVFFCDPQSPWQRGTNENTNSLIRQYLPKKTCLGKLTQADLDKISNQLNNRPRKTLNYKTPIDKMGCVAMTG